MTRRHADVQVIGLPDGTDGPVRKTIPIEAIKEMQQAAGLQPFEGRFKVFIIDGADRLSPEAGNRLLKTLEEPPGAVSLVLLAANEGAVLATIVSRCQTFRLRPVPQLTIQEHLMTRLAVEASRAKLLAALANGDVAWAIQAVADDGLAERRRVQLDQISSLPRLPYHVRLEIARSLAESFGRDRDSGTLWLGLVQQFWRDVVLVKGGNGDAVANEDRVDDLRDLAKAMSFDQLAGILGSISQTGERLAKNANARLAFDVLMLDLPIMGRGVPAGR